MKINVKLKEQWTGNSFVTYFDGKLVGTMRGSKLVLTDEKGGTSTVTIKDVYQK